MEVDPGILRSFAGQVDVAAGVVRTAEIGARVGESCDALAGSAMQFTARAVGQYLNELVGPFAAHIDAMGVAVSGAGDSFVVQDEALAQAFDGIWRVP